MIRFFVAGTPKAMSVGSFFKFKKGGAEHHVQGRRNSEWAVLVGHVGRQHAPAIPFDGPMRFAATFYLPTPQALAKKHRAALPTKRPDVDNLVHKLTDFFNGVFWKDDSQVVELAIAKRYAFDGRTGVEITVEPMSADAEMPAGSPA